MSTHLVYLDTETTGLNPALHHVWEVAWAVDDEPISTCFVGHSLVGADEKALQVNGYWDRYSPSRVEAFQELKLASILTGATIVAANPAFDCSHLVARWGISPWDYSLLDLKSYAMGAMNADRPVPLKTIRAHLVALGYDVPAPDHTAAGDVATLRAAHQALTDMYGTGKLVAK